MLNIRYATSCFISYVKDSLQINSLILKISIVLTLFILLTGFLTDFLYPQYKDVLKLSLDTPWGIVTSIFVHKDLQHALENLVGLWIWSSFIALINRSSSAEENKGRLKFIIGFSFFSALIANLIYMLFFPQTKSAGASGFLFALEGVLAGFSITNLIIFSFNVRKLLQKISYRHKIILILSLFFLVYFFVLAVFFTELYIGKLDTGTNVAVHGLSFLIAVPAVMANEIKEYIVKKIGFWNLVNLVSFAIAIFSIFITFYLSEKESLEQFKTLEPAVLDVSHDVDLSNTSDERLVIHIKNVARFKHTGNISFYKLEIDPHKPEQILSSLEPNQNTTLNLSINYTEVGILNCSFPSITVPASKLYYVEKGVSISYRLTCDNCRPEGVVRRIPPFQAIEGILTIDFKDNKKCLSLILPIYSWTHYQLSDIVR